MVRDDVVVEGNLGYEVCKEGLVVEALFEVWV
jgi:hypothetical protein